MQALTTHRQSKLVEHFTKGNNFLRGIIITGSRLLLVYTLKSLSFIKGVWSTYIWNCICMAKKYLCVWMKNHIQWRAWFLQEGGCLLDSMMETLAQALCERLQLFSYHFLVREWGAWEMRQSLKAVSYQEFLIVASPFSFIVKIRFSLVMKPIPVVLLLTFRHLNNLQKSPSSLHGRENLC